MKRKLLGLVAIFCFFVSLNMVSYAVSEVDYNNVRILGRTVEKDGKIEFNWPMSGFEFETDGTDAYVYISYCDKTSYVNVLVDKNTVCERLAVSNVGWLKIADNLDEGTHTIKVTRSSEGVNGLLSFSSVKINDGTYIKPTQAKARKMEFIGDSYTVGYGNLEYGADSNVKNAANTDTWRSYAGYASRLLDADANIVAMSGKGVCMNYIASTATSIVTDGNIAQQYAYANPVTSGANLKEWNFEKYIPQVVVVFLGTNDHNGTNPRGNNPQYFYEEYKKFLKTISSKYPDAHIFCCSKPSASYGEYVEKAVEDMQNDKYHFVTLTSFKGSGVHSHPYYTEAYAMAEELVQKINEAAKDVDIWQEGNAPKENAVLDALGKKIYIGGNVSASEEDDSVTMFLVNKDVSDDNISFNDVAHIDEALVDEGGKYKFLFPFKDDINNYKLLINKNGRNISQTVKEITSVYDAISVNLDITSDLTLSNGDNVSEIITSPSKVKAAFKIDNFFENNTGNYTAVITFYDEKGNLLSTHFDKEKEFGLDVEEKTVWYDIPNNAKKAKAFIWTTLYQSMPLCKADNISFVK